MSLIPTTYATIDVQTERLGELQLLLNTNGFRLQWVEDKTRERWTLEDEPRPLAADESA